MSRSRWILCVVLVAIIVGAAIEVYFVPRPYYVSGIVDHQKIGRGTKNGQSVSWYTVSINLENDDPLNNIKKGQTLGYIVSKADWEKVWPGDRVEARVNGNAEAEIVKVDRDESELKLKVQYENGSAAPYALVAIINQRWLTDKNESRAVVANSEGKCVFTSLMPDSYYAYAYKGSYNTVVEASVSWSTVDSRWTFPKEELQVTLKL